LQKDPWGGILTALRQQTDQQIVEHWLVGSKGYFADSETMIIEVPNQFTHEWIISHYGGLILQIARSLCKNPALQVRYTISAVSGEVEKNDEIPPQETAKPVVTESVPSAAKGEIFLNSKYLFSTFVVGPSNRFAHAAALAVAESPAKAYNPLFIYGGVGLGKTHLMQAIGHFLLEKNRSLKILYIPSERFTNHLISAIQNRAMSKFREKYRNMDILLIDDVQFIAGKESTQEEFFHTFNTLYDSHKQVVVTSDRSPKEIPRLEERLISRFEWGLVTDIQPPDLETRVAILRKKAERDTLVIPDEVTDFIAQKFRLNIRELEGALIRVVANSSVMNQPITLAGTKEILKNLLVESEERLSMEGIQEAVANYFQVSASDMKAKRKTRSIVYPRQIAIFLIRELTPHSLSEIGVQFGGRDHTTVLHACEKIAKEIQTNDQVRKTINHLTLQLKR
jgi:chromosomal replication initiator protein